jgi:hypothetical protein
MDEDDLPPAPGAPQEPTAAGSLGRLFGALVFLGVFAAVAGGVLYVLTHWSH